MTTLPPGGEYQQAPRVGIGWWLWLGTHWEQVKQKRIDREHVYYTTHRVYRVGYLEAVLCRRTPPPALPRRCHAWAPRLAAQQQEGGTVAQGAGSPRS